MGYFSKYSTSILIGLCLAAGFWGLPYIIVNSYILIFEVDIFNPLIVNIIAGILTILGFILGFAAVFTTSEVSSY